MKLQNSTKSNRDIPSPPWGRGGTARRRGPHVLLVVGVRGSPPNLTELVSSIRILDATVLAGHLIPNFVASPACNRNREFSA